MGGVQKFREWPREKMSVLSSELLQHHCLSPETTSPIKAELREFAIGTPRCPLASVSASHMQGDHGKVAALGLSPPLS